jgi:MoxR-like ATPase
MSKSNNLYRCTPRQLRGFILDCLYAGLVPMVKGSPGTGKSSIIASVSDELQVKMIDHRASTSEPTDFTGLPGFNAGKAFFSPFEELFPLESTPIPDGYQGWMIFFDEFNSASKSVQAAMYKIILDRMVGQHKLHPNVVLACAGNLATDRAIVNSLSTAMQSRLVHLELELSHQEWMEDVALKQGYDSRIIAYLSQYPSKLMDFRPDHNEHTFLVRGPGNL